MRWYDPGTGRWTQQDSLETLLDPSRSNRYEYAAGNPVNYVDPTGRDFGDFLQGASTALGVAATFAGPYSLAVGAVAAGVGVAAGIANGESAGQIVGGAALDLTSGLVGFSGAAVGAATGAQIGVGLAYEGIGACYDYC